MSDAGVPARPSIVGERAPWFWGGCAAIALGVRGRATGLVAGATKFGGVAVQASRWSG